ncbi:MAG: urea carboxylase-associated family protein [Chloroflexi bacterium]|nr:urea carboxylase-associated family protein [Chloroflexota bacterium]
MPAKLAKDLVIPKCEGRAFEVLRGQVFRVVEFEGPQVGDMTLLNLRDFRETFSSQLTASANNKSFRKASKLISCPPFLRQMASVIDDKTGVHWVHGRCTRLFYELRGQKNHRNCQDNIVESLVPWGLSEYEVPFGTFNIFMNVEMDENCHYLIKEPIAVKGDYIDFVAEMDLLVSISACPLEDACNAYEPKSLQVQIFEDL